MIKLGVLCSGRGTDLQSIIDAIADGKLDAQIAIVLTDKPNVMALERAARAGIKNECIDRKSFADQLSFEAKILNELRGAEVELVILAGFMRILSPMFVRAYKERIMNIHPSLLPAFPGAHAHRDVLAYGVKISGCTVHFVDEGTDSGPIILQAAVPCSKAMMKSRWRRECSSRSTSFIRAPFNCLLKVDCRSKVGM